MSNPSIPATAANNYSWSFLGSPVIKPDVVNGKLTIRPGTFNAGNGLATVTLKVGDAYISGTGRTPASIAQDLQDNFARAQGARLGTLNTEYRQENGKVAIDVQFVPRQMQGNGPRDGNGFN